MNLFEDSNAKLGQVITNIIRRSKLCVHFSKIKNIDTIFIVEQEIETSFKTVFHYLS
jgi:hypothetical protein